MKLPQIFVRTPNHKRFNFTPRHYDPLEDERRERERMIQLELERKTRNQDEIIADLGHRDRIAGSFRKAKKTVDPQKDPSANMLRLIVLMIITLGLVAFIQWGKVALIVTAFLFIPLYLYLKFRRRN